MERLMTYTNMLKELDHNQVMAVAIFGIALCVAERISDLNIEITSNSIKTSVKFA